MKQLLYIFLILLAFSQAKGQQFLEEDLKSGDLIFVGAKTKNLSGAINRVTQRSSTKSYDHVGLIERNNDSLYILHASGDKGSHKELLQVFLSEQSDSVQMGVYRLKDPFQAAIPSALQVANNSLGKPYNWTYVLNDSSYYCSDYIEIAFRQDHIFKLEPMTFINPATKKIDKFWLTYYQKLGLEVPEGQLGCNPNGLAASDKLRFLGILLK